MPSFREDLFTEARFPIEVILVNWASGVQHSRKPRVIKKGRGVEAPARSLGVAPSPVLAHRLANLEVLPG